MQHIRTAIVFAFVFVLFCFLFFKKAYTANECTLEWFSLITCNSCILSFSGGGLGEGATSHTFQMMVSQLAKRSARVLPADLCTDHEHYVTNHRFNGFEKKQKHGGPRQDCFSLLHFGNSQFFWFYVAFQT